MHSLIIPYLAIKEPETDKLPAILQTISADEVNYSANPFC